MRKIIVVTKCDDCPYNHACPAWGKLTRKQRVTLTLGVGVGDFILKDCELKDAPIIDDPISEDDHLG
jgi:hypothetical protein